MTAEQFAITFTVVVVILLFFLLFSEGRARAGEFHVNGPGDVHCAECDGECREIDYPQTSLKEFE